MRTWKILLVAAALIGFGSAITCHVREKRRIEWNDRLVGIISEALNVLTEFREGFLTELERVDTDYNDLQEMSSKSMERIAPLSEQIEAMKPIKGGEEMYSAAGEFLDLLQLLLSRSHEFASVPMERPFDTERFTTLAAEIDELWEQVEQKHREATRAQANMARRFRFGLRGR